MSVRVVFMDTETTSLRPDRRAWDVALIVRDSATGGTEFQWFVDAADLDLAGADPRSLAVGRFYERHPQALRGSFTAPCGTRREKDVLLKVEVLTRDAVTVGVVPSFDTDVLGTRMRAHGICPSWHYYPLDAVTLAAGFLHGRRHRQNEVVDGYPPENGWEPAPGLTRWDEPPRQTALPWDTEELSRALGVEPPPDGERHSALGDTRWARDIWDTVMGERR